MEKENFLTSFKIGLLLVALAYFIFSLYQFIKGSIHGAAEGWPFWILLTDTTGIIGMAFRVVGGFFALVAVSFFVVKRDLSKSESFMTLRWILLAEIIYWLGLLPSGVWGFSSIFSGDSNLNLGFIIETGIPCFVAPIALTVVLVKLFFELNHNKSSTGAIKWGLISGTVFVFVFWLNNTCNWVSAVMTKGIEYLTSYPINMLSFGLTTIGLLLLTVFMAIISRKSFGIQDWQKLDLRSVGVAIIALGLYFDLIYMFWLFFGSVGGWGTWYAWFFGHNLDLWALSLPLVGLPLLFIEQIK
jgi:hypothetical protein